VRSNLPAHVATPAGLASGEKQFKMYARRSVLTHGEEMRQTIDPVDGGGRRHTHAVFTILLAVLIPIST
jgi:hypothetical protein